MFNAVDWHAPFRPFPGKSADAEAVAAYREWAGARFTVYVFGVDAEGRSVALKVAGFRPYFYVRGPDGFSETRLTNVATDVVARCSPRPRHVHGEHGYEGEPQRGPPPIAFEIVQRRDMWGFAAGRTTAFVKFTCDNVAILSRARNMFEKPRRGRRALDEYVRDIEKWLATDVGQCRPYESRVEPLLRFMHERDLRACGWIRVKAGRYQEGGGHTSCARNYVARAGDVGPDHAIMRLAPMRVASFDIECTSAHGDFPQAVKTYRKLAGELYMARGTVSTPADVVDVIVTSFLLKSVVPKAPLDEAAVRALAWSRLCGSQGQGGGGVTAAGALFDVLRGTSRTASLFSVLGAKAAMSLAEKHRDMLSAVDLKEARAHLRGLRVAAEDVAAEEARDGSLAALNEYIPRLVRAPSAAAAAANPKAKGRKGADEEDGDEEGGVDIEKDRALYLLNGVLTAVFPPLEGDAIINVSTTVHRYGVPGLESRHSAALARRGIAPFADASVVVSPCATEREVIEAWVGHMVEVDPDVLCGYNIFGFDWEYLWDRAGEVGARPALRSLSRLASVGAEFKRVWQSSSAMGDNYNKYLSIPGRMSADIMKLTQREKQLDSYKLDNVAHEFLGETKHDVSPQDIFRMFKGHAPEDLRTIAEYCVQDCALVNKLVVKFRVLENNSQMANVCSVPLSYIFMRGQGIKIFSIVVKTCAALGVVVPTVRPCESAGCTRRPAYDYPATWEERELRRDRRCGACRSPGMTLVLPGSFQGADDDDAGGQDAYAATDKYEGAIVLPPEPKMHLNEATIVFDYNSLYPNSIISENLCPSTIVLDPAFAAVPGVEYNVIEVEGVQHRFATSIKGVLPVILVDFLRERKNVRKRMEYVYLETGDGRRLVGLPVPPAQSGEEGAGREALLDVTTNERFEVATADVVRRGDAYDAGEKAVLDGLQLSLKVTANSLYGQTGSRTSAISMRAIAACTTAVGRAQILKAKAFVEEKYGAKVIYGDSVMPHTPVTLRVASLDDGGQAEVRAVAAEDIVGSFGGAWAPYPGLLLGDAKDGDAKERWEPPESALAAWTTRGWSPVLRVIRHRTTKAVYRVSVEGGGVVDVTEDHSLLRSDGSLVAPRDLVSVASFAGDSAKGSTDVLLQLPVGTSDGGMPVARVAAFDPTDVDVRKHHGCYVKVQAHSHVAAQLAVLRYGAMGLELVDARCCAFEEDPPCSCVLLTFAMPMADDAPPLKGRGRVRSVQRLHDAYAGYVYDLETEEGVFAAGVGSLIVKNTDSIFVHFPTPAGLTDRERLVRAIALGKEVEGKVKAILKPPQALAYEKVLYPLIILSKKRYVGLLYEDDPDAKPKLKYMGIALKRRDVAPICKKVFRRVLDAILEGRDVAKGVQCLRDDLDALQAGRVDMRELVVSKTLRAEYKDPTRIAHKVLAERIGERDPGNKPACNERIPYVYVVVDPPPGGRKLLQGDRIEAPGYAAEMRLPLDYGFYISNQIMVPVAQLLALALEELPGYAPPAPGEPAWTQERRQVEAQFLLFRAYLDVIPGCASRFKAEKKAEEAAANRPPPVPRVRVQKDGSWSLKGADESAMAEGGPPAGSSRDSAVLRQMRGLSEAMSAVLARDLDAVVVLSETPALHRALTEREKKPVKGGDEVLGELDDLVQDGLSILYYRDAGAK